MYPNGRNSRRDDPAPLQERKRGGRHGEHLKDLLVGQILWVGKTQIAWLAGITAVLVLAMASGLVQKLGRFGFYATFAIAVTASVQLVGVYLVFTSLIVPALATRGMTGRARYIGGYAVEIGRAHV